MTSVVEASGYQPPTAAGPKGLRAAGGEEKAEKTHNIKSPGSDTAMNDGDAMDMSDGPAETMGPPPVVGQNNMQNATKIANARAQSTINNSANPANGASMSNGGSGGGNATAAAAAAAAAAASTQQPKVVQTAFIHKLYNMLEDQSIQHLISWSNTGDSFLISPTAEFSKVLASYFKHTQISSFVRQLNMYGFHKVSDVFHSTSPETALWEFKHGNGNFKKGDLAGLKEIKRRASRQTLTHREPFAPSTSKPPPIPVAPVADQPTDPLEARFHHLEQNLYDAHSRLARAEEHIGFMFSKCQMLTDSALKCLQSSQELTSLVTAIVPDPGHQVHRDALAAQAEITRQVENIRNFESHHQNQVHHHRPSYPTHNPLDNAVPVSPFQLAQDDQPSGGPGAPQFRFNNPFQSSHSTISPERRGSQGLRPSSPLSRNPITSTLPRPGLPSGPPHNADRRPFASAAFGSPNLARRHTSGDIAQDWQQGGQPHVSTSSSEQVGPTQQARSPFESGQSSAQFPSSPRQPPPPGGSSGPVYQQIRDSLARYQLSSGGRSASTSGPAISHYPSTPNLSQNAAHQRQTTPPPPVPPPSSFRGYTRNAPHSADGQWSSPRTVSSNFRDNNNAANQYGSSSSLPPSRRSSVAHLLNPDSSGGEHGGDDDHREQQTGDEDRKRKRIA